MRVYYSFMELIRTIPNQELETILSQTSGGEYVQARTLVSDELARRASVLLSLGTADMPAWDGLE